MTSCWRQTFLSLSVHADAFQSDPIGYLQAVAWRVRGLKLRSRHRLAALTARSPRAYDLWMERDEPRLAADFVPAATNLAPPILVVIDCRYSMHGLTETLSSLRAAKLSRNAVIIGDATDAAMPVLDRPAQLADFAASSEIWLCPIRAGDRLATGAIPIYALAAADAGAARIIYSDDDLIDSNGCRHSPHLKPSWNPELFENHDFISGSAIVRANGEILKSLPDDDWQQALIEKAMGGSATPKHLPRVLHHRRERAVPIVPAKPADLMVDPAPAVTVIVPTRNKADLLRTCIDGLRRTAYPSMDIIVVDNDSDEADALDYLHALEGTGIVVLQMSGEFNFSALNNAAVRAANGALLCFLNNDVEILDSDWLALLVRQAVRSDIGAVGARLLYPDGTIQHAGVCTGLGGGAGHAHRVQHVDESGYFERARLPQRVTAVTAACLVVAQDKFLAVGGFDEKDFPVAFNDVDLCLKLNAHGWQSFYEPRATLIHHESKSRGSDSSPANRSRFAHELAALKRKWRTDEDHDPYHHPHLSRFCEQFVIGL